jgi:hypothetical protein
MNTEEINKMTGANNYQKVEAIKLNKIQFNGQTGTFVKTCLLEDKVTENGEERFKTIDLGKELKVVFLKHRRVLTQYIKGKPSPTTNEHNSKDDYVTLFTGKEKESGKASILREKYPGLRTVQVVYAYVPSLKETVKLSIKGASLSSEVKAKDVPTYYSYLASFKNEHSWQFITELSPVAEKGPMGTYFCINFKKGEKLTEEQINKAVEIIKDIHEKITAQDEYALSKIPKDVFEQEVNSEIARVDKYRKDVAEQTKKNEANPVPVVEYPEDEINPEDIPF